MRKLLAVVTGALLLALVFATASSAATVIYYSKADNSYGWCAGYSYARGEACAKGQCEKYGSDCFLAVECPGGYGAGAFAADPAAGFGATCKWANANSARAVALMACVAASNALCNTSDAFTSSGSVTSAASNAAFDRGYYAQGMLAVLGYYSGNVDGDLGSKSRAAVKAFQSDLGLDATGQVDDQLFDLLLFSSRGTAALVATVTAGYKAQAADLVDITWAWSDKPAGTQSLTAELAARSSTDQRYALAAIMTLAKVSCTLPGQAASVLDQAAQTWSVDCAEGPFTVALAGTAPVITPGHGSDGDTVTHHNDNARSAH